jgi:uncharacterized protein (DUF488 family)
MKQTVWTIGHSTRPIDDFLALLSGAEITFVADVRRFPGSRRYPQFNRETLSRALGDNGIEYVSIPELGGRREPRVDSTNTAWRNAGFRGYADYMETQEFERGIERMIEMSKDRRLAMMCSEAAWTDCHRSLISDYLKVRGYPVLHILLGGKQEQHPYTRAAHVVNGRLSYDSGSANLNFQ